jgi:heme iron utilization protein
MPRRGIASLAAAAAPRQGDSRPAEGLPMPRPDPVRPADPAAITMAQTLLADARHAALAYTDHATRSPGISRIALGLADGTPVTLISALSAHYTGLTAQPDCAVMVGEPGGRGDPLTHPRLMIQARASFIARHDPTHATLRDQWLRTHPKAKLYIDFADFAFVRLIPQGALLNAGFGQAYRLMPADLTA